MAEGGQQPPSAVAQFLEKGGGSHTQFKGALSTDLHSRLKVTIKQRTGPSFEERIQKAVVERSKKAAEMEAEQRKKLQHAIEKGREHGGQAMQARPASAAPKQSAQLVLERQQRMKEQEAQYQEHLDALKDKMDRREPLFKLEEVAAAFDDMKKRKTERRRMLAKQEADTWAHIRDVYQDAHRRPLLVEDYLGKPPPKKMDAGSASAPDLGDPLMGKSGYASDRRLSAEISKNWFKQTDWGKKVQQIKEKADNRQKLHEIQYPPKGRDFSVTNSLLSYNFPANKTAPSARGK
jgi:hypothetical protein